MINFPQQMAIDIASFEDIDRLTSINGVSIETIEKRARPGQDATSGFLGENESFKEVLKQDWLTVQKLGTTHIELAEHLKCIINVAQKNSKSKTFIRYDFRNLKNSTLRRTEGKNISTDNAKKLENCTLKKTDGCFKRFVMRIRLFAYSLFFLLTFRPSLAKQTISQDFKVSHPFNQLTVEKQQHKGIQADLFRQDENNEFEGGWSMQYKITNLNNEESILLGAGIPSYIAKYGFYEGGGSKNAYRIDPQKLKKILCG